jgi:hypothetical protein
VPDAPARSLTFRHRCADALWPILHWLGGPAWFPREFREAVADCQRIARLHEAGVKALGAVMQAVEAERAKQVQAETDVALARLLAQANLPKQ